MTAFKMRVLDSGGKHVDVTVFAGESQDALAHTGTLRMLPEEMQALVALMAVGAATVEDHSVALDDRHG